MTAVRRDERVRALARLHTLARGGSDAIAGFDGGGPDGAPPLLDPRSHALVRIAGLLASGACAVTCSWAAQRARQAGATDVEIASVLIAIGAVIGGPRLVEAAPAMAAAIGCDLDEAFEAPVAG